MTTIKLQIPPDLLAAVDRFIEEEVPCVLIRPTVP